MRYLFSAALYAASAFTLFSGLDSHAASFDCSRAENKAEILICGVPELSALDVKLAKLYRQAREAVSDRVELRNQQRAWLKERNQCDHVACLQNLYQKRIVELTTVSGKYAGAETVQRLSPADNPVQGRHERDTTKDARRERELDVRTDTAVHLSKRMQEAERKISGLPRTDLAVLTAAAKINALAVKKLESGPLSEQQRAFVWSIALHRLVLLAGRVDMPTAVIQCHLAEAKAFEESSRGKPVKAVGCRSDAYGPVIQAEIWREGSKPYWPELDRLTSEWVAAAYMYAEEVGNISEYGRVFDRDRASSP